MSHICPTCNSSIISQTPSKIGSSECNDTCPQEMTCQDGIYASNCIFYSGSNLSCSGINFGDKLSLAFSKIDTLLCQSGGCKVKVSGTDACCEYLETKVTAGVGVTVTKTTSSGCEKLVISANPASLTWTNLPLNTTYSDLNLGGTIYQKAQYSNKDELGRIWFRGSFTKTQGYSLPSGGSEGVLSTLFPANLRPISPRLTFNGRSTSSLGFNNTLQLTINPDGSFVMKNFSGVVFDTKGAFSLDGFFIDTNP